MINFETVRKEGEFRESLQETDWAWLAGVIDWGGKIEIQRGYTKNNGGWIWYKPCVSVQHTHIEPMTKIAQMLEANIQKSKMYSLEICSREKVQEILGKVIPYMVVKLNIAILVHQLVSLPRGSGHRKEELYQKSLLCR